MSYYDTKTQVNVAIMDFSKAFDVVSHICLLSRIQHYGIRGDTHRWIGTFLTQRNRSVLIDRSHSSKVHVNSGVPQGTVLGSLLFLLYINDLLDCISFQVRVFVDVCLLNKPITSLWDQIQLQDDLTLTAWADTWGMSFNPSKCYIPYTCQNKKISTYLYQLCGCILSKVSNCKYLGVTLNKDLQQNTHVNNICTSASRTLGFLWRNLKRCPIKLRELAYFALVPSKLKNGSSV